MSRRAVPMPRTKEEGRLLDIPTLQQFKFYRKVIVPRYAHKAGFESLEEAHNHLKAGFFWLHPDDPRVPSMASMSFEECDRFIMWSIRQLAEMGVVIVDREPAGPVEVRHG